MHERRLIDLCMANADSVNSAPRQTQTASIAGLSTSAAREKEETLILTYLVRSAGTRVTSLLPVAI